MIKIVPLQPYQIEQAKQVAMAVCLKIWQEVLTEEESNYIPIVLQLAAIAFSFERQNSHMKMP